MICWIHYGQPCQASTFMTHSADSWVTGSVTVRARQIWSTWNGHLFFLSGLSSILVSSALSNSDSPFLITALHISRSDTISTHKSGLMLVKVCHGRPTRVFEFKFWSASCPFSLRNFTKEDLFGNAVIGHCPYMSQSYKSPFGKSFQQWWCLDFLSCIEHI
jgi:hypothetical protein